MAFHKSVMKLSGEYVDAALVLLRQDHLDETSVHDIRVLMKRLRGLLQLYALAGRRDVVAQLNPVLRDVAKTFAVQRDSHVLISTLQQMAEGATKAVASQLQKILQDLTRQTAAAAPVLAADKLAEDLNGVRLQWQRQLADVTDAELLNALARQYRRNRKQGRAALKLRDQAVLHDWRKRAKYFYYQLCVFPEDTVVSHAEMEQLRKLGSVLGKVHDLDVLVDYLLASGYDNPPVLRVITKRRVRQIKKIRRLYRRLFSCTTKGFRKRLRHYETIDTDSAW